MKWNKIMTPSWTQKIGKFWGKLTRACQILWWKGARFFPSIWKRHYLEKSLCCSCKTTTKMIWIRPRRVHLRRRRQQQQQQQQPPHHLFSLFARKKPLTPKLKVKSTRSQSASQAARQIQSWANWVYDERFYYSEDEGRWARPGQARPDVVSV